MTEFTGSCNRLSLPQIDNKPWWKERLKSKYLGLISSRDDKSHYLDVKSWIFLKDGPDYFKSSFLPLFENKMEGFVQGNKGCKYNLVEGTYKSASAEISRKQFLKEVEFLKKIAKQQKCFTDVNQVEMMLKRHQLALYPHLEECLPSEVFEDIVEMLDPEMHTFIQEDLKKEKQVAEEIDIKNQSLSRNDQPSIAEGTKQMVLSKRNEIQRCRNPYVWQSYNKEPKKDKKRTLELRKHEPQNEDENIHKVTADFCSWISSLGGDNNNIEESTLTSLFASGYETKPAVTIPVHVLELTNVPPELRRSQNIASQSETGVNPSEDQRPQIQNGYARPLVKFNYGAWYLKPKLWRLRPATEPLSDPKDSKNKEMSEAKKKSLNLDCSLATMHGTKLFKDFVDKRDIRKPEFLRQLVSIPAEKSQDEQEIRPRTERRMRKRQQPLANLNK